MSLSVVAKVVARGGVHQLEAFADVYQKQYKYVDFARFVRMNIQKSLLLLITLLVALLSNVEARQRANKHEDMGIKTGLSRLDMFGRAKRLVPLRMDVVQRTENTRSKRELDPFDAEMEEEKHRSSGII